ncbi:DUF3703 domain-containing protein [Leptospira gomenensis]|uniref:DUF3703 domain-containing protein n=1 Tax=Leptospira gomenensis TaxID=2484974 RepID=A0A5F1YHR2_9LEPT|nr:DUF3703 domain-containing protein [Leptospira gomenensis]TGK39195.1 DUF3703 domain-containing protein [Leptospira gomenensis]TGK44264.1 DUF3703 domain-containing protein [Leptospira gomenensis]TGK45066.1 DUF3703 domain-containing protein [Leptospira gomenensis]TGK65126.1 DUF3703 domain-containing protein [Leptospira gomenensis]
MNLKMPARFKEAYYQELRAYKQQMAIGDQKAAWRFLERAHLIGQYHPIPHTGIHFRMLVFAIRTADPRECLGQLLRLSVGWFGSLWNRIPVGNTGGANVPILASLPIPPDLRELLADADTSANGLSGLTRKNER